MRSSMNAKDIDTKNMTDEELARKAQEELALEGDMEEVSNSRRSKVQQAIPI